MTFKKVSVLDKIGGAPSKSKKHGLAVRPVFGVRERGSLPHWHRQIALVQRLVVRERRRVGRCNKAGIRTRCPLSQAATRALEEGEPWCWCQAEQRRRRVAARAVRCCSRAGPVPKHGCQGRQLRLVNVVRACLALLSEDRWRASTGGVARWCQHDVGTTPSWNSQSPFTPYSPRDLVAAC